MRYRVSLMPAAYRNRPQYVLKPTSITVHNTANPDATAANHEKYLNAQPRSASWHITVDDIEAVLHIPLNEQAWHAGTHAGNTSSIGIEVCEFTNAKRAAAAEANCQTLIAAMLTGTAPAAFRAAHLGLDNVRTHMSWSGKYCPRVILPRWVQFIAGIKAIMEGGADVADRIIVVIAPAGSDRERAVLAEAERQALRSYIIDPAATRITRQNPKGDPQ